ncbi:MAG: methionine adenosyltransferase [Candidatus Woesearchaeota archaeon]|nr:methionine adenosyltransferase [Candidatus Woesearchaeota archaeon]MDP7476110.1 methionine adenosyltransferase [Candidatus Woesearchaeota archaeon]HJO01524.1 methionine adenosyltransferase [Candidatus Woesearchaeota archaeon]
MTKIEFFTSESVTEGHPDKICDQLSDAILDDLIKQDIKSRVAIECLTTTGTVHVAGEVTTKGWANVPKIVRGTLRDIGYTDPEFGIDCEDAGVWVSIHSQSADISQGVSEGQGEDKEQGAGDQGMMYGFACNETPELMPFPVIMAHKLTRRLAYVRKEGIVKGLGPDGKSQVSVEYHDGKPKRLNAVVIAQQHTENIADNELKEQINEHVIKPICDNFLDEKTRIHINATGKFVIGGPEGDTGVTGRKIIVDTYGGIGRHGGGAFSGKDPSKVDRSGAYAARYVAKNIVAAGLADKCEVQLSYAIGVAEPTSINVDTFSTNKIPEEKIVELVKKHFPLTPKWIIEKLDLLRPIYKKTSTYGHFGRNDPDFTWEKTDMAEILRKDAGLEEA